LSIQSHVTHNNPQLEENGPRSKEPKFDYGDTVVITAGKHIGDIRSVVGINGSKQSRTYTVEFGDGSDCEVAEDSLTGSVPDRSPDIQR
jgi:hypothetical protein